MQPPAVKPKTEVYVSIGVFAWNEQEAIVPMLNSFFEQSLFAELAQRNLRCEVICVTNGCTDRTPEVARELLEGHMRRHDDLLTCRVEDLPERGKLNAWNQFVHALSANDASVLLMMDADILLHEKQTLWRMIEALEKSPNANVTVDQPRKDISFKPRRSLRERLSLGASKITGSASAQLCAQLYCIRAEVARNIYLPKDLGACEDGFIKQIVCTDSLTQAVAPERILLTQNAEHTFEAYTSFMAILKNQKRQIIGQTVVHLLVDNYLQGLPLAQRLRLADTLKQHDRDDPLWLKRLIQKHLQKVRFCWRLHPGLVMHRLKRLSGLNGLKRLKCFPAAAAGSLMSLAACWMAYRTLKAGSTDYWPRAPRLASNRAGIENPPAWTLTATSNNPK